MYFQRTNFTEILQREIVWAFVLSLDRQKGWDSCVFSGVAVHAREPVSAVSSVTESLTLTSKPDPRLTHPREPYSGNKNYRLSVPRSKNFDISRHLEIFEHDENKDGGRRTGSRQAECSSSVVRCRH